MLDLGPAVTTVIQSSPAVEPGEEFIAPLSGRGTDEMILGTVHDAGRYMLAE